MWWNKMQCSLKQLIECEKREYILPWCKEYSSNGLWVMTLDPQKKKCYPNILSGPAVNYFAGFGWLIFDFQTEHGNCDYIYRKLYKSRRM